MVDEEEPEAEEQLEEEDQEAEKSSVAKDSEVVILAITAIEKGIMPETVMNLQREEKEVVIATMEDALYAMRRAIKRSIVHKEGQAMVTEAIEVAVEDTEEANLNQRVIHLQEEEDQELDQTLEVKESK